MKRDVRQEPTYKQVEEYFRKLHVPGFGMPSAGLNPQASPDGTRVAFTATVWTKLQGTPVSRVGIADLATGHLRQATAGPNGDCSPRWSPDGRTLAFLSDRKKKGRFQLYFLTEDFGEAHSCPEVGGTIEFLSWSPTGSQILMAVAGLGADAAGGQGSGTMGGFDEDLPEWTPILDAGPAPNEWRRLWLYSLETDNVRVLSREGLNVWEAAWAGPERIAAVVSMNPGENAWYDASLALIDAATGTDRLLRRSSRQLGLPAANRSGSRIAIVEAICSDRGLVAGDLVVLDSVSGDARRIETNRVDVTQVIFTGEDELFYIGLRGLHTVAGSCDVVTGRVKDLWDTDETCGWPYPEAAPLHGGGFALILESYSRPPEIAVVGSDGGVRTIATLANEGSRYVLSIAGRLEKVTWKAADGLEIEGLLALPPGDGPYPLVLQVHGGPVWAYRNSWLLGQTLTPLLVQHGYAVLHPNPRGSSGRGQKFAELVYGDMGGADTHDHLSGIRALVDRGIVDPKRIGTTGISYGGYMSAWLVTQSEVFAAAVPQSPITNWYSQHNTSNIGVFDTRFLNADPFAAGDKFFERSPVMFASRVKCPVFQTAGAVDTCTPPSQAIEFHKALLEHGVKSELAIYPGEGHAVRRFRFPAAIDHHARVLDWFLRHMAPAERIFLTNGAR